ncbi:hypothetical protein K504DRAFT_462452 [Pleomassaria siparia CBS 279.74]|uniref:Uncharacterized protein n=1 Tax=Pleomassaria siparia CBS 279.74 TaxID=1314801 RepID=A0A6G1KN84_9PLEO|nr:hypothetical protein K504DRAFT_462452 [Pleomassaria siparia CBS 279.74]
MCSKERKKSHHHLSSEGKKYDIRSNTSLMHIKSSYQRKAAQRRCTSRDVQEGDSADSTIYVEPGRRVRGIGNES